MEKEKKKMDFYTEENPGGPWSRALQAMIERDRRLKEEGKRRREKQDK